MPAKPLRGDRRDTEGRNSGQKKKGAEPPPARPNPPVTVSVKKEKRGGYVKEEEEPATASASTAAATIAPTEGNSYSVDFDLAMLLHVGSPASEEELREAIEEYGRKNELLRRGFLMCDEELKRITGRHFFPLDQAVRHLRERLGPPERILVGSSLLEVKKEEEDEEDGGDAVLGKRNRSSEADDRF